MDTVHKQAEFVGNAIVHGSKWSDRVTSRIARVTWSRGRSWATNRVHCAAVFWTRWKGDIVEVGNPSPNFLLPINAASDLLVHKILLWLGYPMVKIFRRYLYSFWRNSRTWQTHRQTDRHRMTAYRPRLCIASRGKNVQRKSCEFRFIRGFYVSISIQNILKGNLQPKFKGANLWPKSTAVITGVIFTCPGRAGPVFSDSDRTYKAASFTASNGAIYSLRIMIYGWPLL